MNVLIANDINNMEPGRELDALVAEKVMGWVKGEYANGRWYAVENGVKTHSPKGVETWRPSTDISAAWEVVGKLQNSVVDFDLERRYCIAEMEWIATFVVNGKSIVATGLTAPEAICKAALIAKMVLPKAIETRRR